MDSRDFPPDTVDGMRRYGAKVFFVAMIGYVLAAFVALGYIHEGATGWQLLTHFWYVWVLALCLLVTSYLLMRHS